MASLAQQIPVLIVAVPLFTAPLCVLVGTGRPAWWLALLSTLFAFVGSCWIVWDSFVEFAIDYKLGGWAPPWGIEYRIDIVNALILLLVAGMATLALIYGARSVNREIPRGKQHLFYAAFVLCVTGLMGIAATGDAFNVFVFLEISSLSSYSLISMGRHRKALTAAFQYLIMGTVGATFLLIGIGLLYMVTGTLNMADLHERLRGLADQRPVMAAFAFIMIGIALKAAVFPLHLWLPNAYAYAPTVVSLFLAATATKVSLYLLFRFIFSVFDYTWAYGAMQFGWFLVIPGIAAAIIASIAAVYQLDVKRMLAYSSVAQVGYIVVGIALATPQGLSAAIIHMFNHALIKGGLFAALGCIFYRTGSVRLTTMAGLAKQMPWTLAAFVISGLSLIGVPLTNGFISKWVLVQAVADAGQWWLAVLLLISTLIAIIYVWRVIEMAYLKPIPPQRMIEGEAPLSMLIPTWILAIANLYFGLFTQFPLAFAERLSYILLGGQ